MLAFCELLVRTNVFKEVHLSFLYVGHTHEDIDAAFSRVSEKLRKTEAETLVGLIDLLPNSKQTGGLYDIKGWLEKHINPIKGHTVPLHFKFSLDATGKICVQYKGNNHRPWKQLKNTLLKKIPPGIPSISVPDNFNKKFNFDALEKNIERSKYLFSDILQNTQYRWWKRYITFLRETSENENKQILYAKKDARWLLPLLPKSTLHSQEEYLLPQEIQEMVDREIDDPEVEMPEEKKKKKTNPNSQVRRRSTTQNGPSDSSGKKKSQKTSSKDKTKKNSAAKVNKNGGKKPTLQQRKNLSKSKRSGKTRAAQRKTNVNAKHSDKKKRQQRTRNIVHSYVYYYQRTEGGDKLKNFLELLLIFELIIFFCGYCIAMHLSIVELLSVFNELIRLHLEMTLHSPVKSVIIGEINCCVAQCAKPANSMVMLRSLVSGCSA
ncbi:uncharacterized protein LOC143080569 [Mytilus galloprovincialis]|uniref:uncharacterized protein LOC143080569 n=1 Tax=Mytilus galloprovincialis TaxID=29158 RepID=UPI003F7C9221